nr:methyl-accepting chemotaxis protein [Treponema sp.]
TSEVRAASKEMGMGNKAILVEVNQLRDATSIIEDSMNRISDSAAEINSTSSSLSDISGSVHKSIGEIGNQIDLFTV